MKLNPPPEAATRSVSAEDARHYAQVLLRLYGMFAGMNRSATRAADALATPLAQQLAAQRLAGR